MPTGWTQHLGEIDTKAARSCLRSHEAPNGHPVASDAAEDAVVAAAVVAADGDGHDRIAAAAVAD